MKKIPLILLPGTLCDERLWQHQVKALEDIVEITIVDISRSDTIKGIAKDVLAEAPERFALAGLSLGGIVALEIMRLEPERVLKLALFDTNPNPPREEQLVGWQKVLDSEKTAQFIHEITDELLPALIHPDRQNDEELKRTIHQMAASIGTEGYIRQLKAVRSREDQRSVLSTILCPTMLFVGQQDIVCPPSLSEYMQQQIPHAEMVVIENAGHLPTLEQPSVVNEQMNYWLSIKRNKAMEEMQI